MRRGVLVLAALGAMAFAGGEAQAAPAAKGGSYSMKMYVGGKLCRGCEPALQMSNDGRGFLQGSGFDLCGTQWLLSDVESNESPSRPVLVSRDGRFSYTWKASFSDTLNIRISGRFLDAGRKVRATVTARGCGRVRSASITGRLRSRRNATRAGQTVRCDPLPNSHRVWVEVFERDAGCGVSRDLGVRWLARSSCLTRACTIGAFECKPATEGVLEPAASATCRPRDGSSGATADLVRLGECRNSTDLVTYAVGIDCAVAREHAEKDCGSGGCGEIATRLRCRTHGEVYSANRVQLCRDAQEPRALIVTYDGSSDVV